MGQRGPAPKTVEQLKLSGSYREDRHGDRGTPPQPGGQPFAPFKLSEEAAQLWDVVVPKLTALGVATALDSFELAAMAEHYGSWRRLQRLATEADPPDARLQRMAAKSYTLFSGTAKKFGLNPTDRQRLEVPVERDDFDAELEALMAG